MTNKFVSVLIVGAGPTGLAAANLLGLYGIETLLVERNTGLSDFPRAISIDDEGLRICQALGLRDEVLEHVLLDLGAQYFSHRRLLMRVMPSSRRNGYPLISTFYQPQLEATLLAGLRRFPNVEVLLGHTLAGFTQTEQEVLTSVCTPAGEVLQIACSYLLACDGGKSSIRRFLGISMRGTTFPQRWLVVDGLCENRKETSVGDVGEHTGEASSPLQFGIVPVDPPNRRGELASPTSPTSPFPTDRYATCFYDPVRPVVSIPAPDLHWRWEFMLHAGECEELFLTPDHLHRLFMEIGDEREPHIIRQAIYTFHASYATSFAHGRVFLLGDAAHLLPPFGGQGMNSGLRDAYNLAWKLALVLSGQARSGILATYQQERMPHVMQMIRYASFLGSLVMPSSRLWTFFRDIALRALMKLPPVAASIAEMRIKPESFYKHGLIFADDHRQNRFPAGRLLPQPTVLLPGNRSVLLDELLGSGFALVRLHSDPLAAFKILQADLWQELGIRCICLVPTKEDMQDTTSQNITCALDSQQQIARFLCGQRDHFALIRPDRHVLGMFRVDREETFVAALRERFFV